MFTFNVRKLFRNTFGSWQTATPRRRKPRATFRPILEALEERWLPAGTGPDGGTSYALFWDPTSGSDASNTANWDVSSLGSGTHPSAAPGNALQYTTNINFDGTAGKGGNKSCTWDYTPTYDVGALTFQNGWTQTVSFLDKKGFSAEGGEVAGSSAPTITPNGSSGASAVAAITLTGGARFDVDNGSSLYLTGYSSGNAVFFAGDGTPSAYLRNVGTVTYTGQSSSGGNVDYLKVPVANVGGTFNVNGNAGSALGATLQVSGTSSDYTNNVSFYQSNSNAQTNIYGNGTLWCYNNYTMNAGLLQTTDADTDTLKVGTSTVDGTATLLSGSVKIYPGGTTTQGTLKIVGTTSANNPILNVANVTFYFNIDTSNSNNRSQLIVGNGSSGGRVNFGYDGGTATITVNPLNSGDVTAWNVFYYGSVTGTNSVTVTADYDLIWSNANSLEVDKL